MGFELSGFDRFENMLNNVTSNLARNMRRETLRNGHIVVSKTKEIIFNQEENWAPLKESTIRAKERKGQIEKILMAEGEYARSFAVEEGQSADVAYVGSNHPQAQALEKGYKERNMEARAHLGPAVEKSKEQCLKNWAKAFKEVFQV